MLITSCGGNTEKTSSGNSSGKVENPVSAISSKVMENGLSIYKAHCFACHQTTGTGIKGLYPPLADNKTVTGDKNQLITILLNGMSGEIVINGEKYNQVMIPHNFLNDKQIADVLTYIRNSFGNQANQITAAEVKKMRKQMQN
jgi:mono/diheme cytochrome c family protein